MHKIGHQNLPSARPSLWVILAKLGPQKQAASSHLFALISRHVNRFENCNNGSKINKSSPMYILS